MTYIPSISLLSLSLTLFFSSLLLGGYLTNYILEVKKHTEDWTDASVLSFNTTDLTQALSGLKPLIVYEARVQSQNFNGLSEFSAVASVTTFGEFGN